MQARDYASQQGPLPITLPPPPPTAPHAQDPRRGSLSSGSGSGSGSRSAPPGPVPTLERIRTGASIDDSNWSAARRASVSSSDQPFASPSRMTEGTATTMMSATDSDAGTTGTSPFGMQSNPVMVLSSMQSRLQDEFANEQDRVRFAEALRIRHDWELERRLEMERRELETRAQMLARERIRLQEIQNHEAEQERARCQLYLGQETADVAMPMLTNFGRKLGNLERRRRERRAAGKNSASGESGGSGSNAQSSETAGSAERPPLVTKSSDESGETAMIRPSRGNGDNDDDNLDSPRSPTSRSTGTGSSRNLDSVSSGKDALYESSRRVQQWSGKVADAGGEDKMLAAPKELPPPQVPVEALLVASARTLTEMARRANERTSAGDLPEEPPRPLQWSQPLQLEPPAEVKPATETSATTTPTTATAAEEKTLSPILRNDKPPEEDRRRVLFAENLPNRHSISEERPALARSSSISGASPSSQVSSRATSITLVAGMSSLRRSNSAREQTPSSTGFVVPASPSSHGYSSTFRLAGEESQSPAPPPARFRPNLLRSMSAGTASTATSATHTDSDHNASGADSTTTQAGTSIESGSRSSDKTAKRNPMAWGQALLSPAGVQENKTDQWETRAEARRKAFGLGSGSGSRGISSDVNPIEAAFAAEIANKPPTPRADVEQTTHAESVFGSSSLGPASPGTSTIYSSTASRSSRRRRHPYNGPNLPEIESQDDLDMFHLAFDDADGPQPPPAAPSSIPDPERAISPKTDLSEDLQVRELSSGTDVPVVAPTALSESGASSFSRSSQSKKKHRPSSSGGQQRLPELGEATGGDRSIDEAVRQTMHYMTQDPERALADQQNRHSVLPEIHNGGFLRRHGTFTSARAPLMAIRGDLLPDDPLASDHRFDTIDADQLRSAAEAGDQLAEAHLQARTRRGRRQIERPLPAIEPPPVPPTTPSRKGLDVVRRQSQPLMAPIPEHSRSDAVATPAERKQSAEIAQTFGDASRRSSETSSGAATPAQSSGSSGSVRSGSVASVGSALDSLVSTTLAAVEGKGGEFAVEAAGLPMRIARGSGDSSAASTMDVTTMSSTSTRSGGNVRSTIIVGGGRSTAFTPLGAGMTHRLSSVVTTVPSSSSAVTTSGGSGGPASNRTSPLPPPELSVRGSFIAALTQPSTALLSDVARMASEAGTADRARERRAAAAADTAAKRTAAAALIPVAAQAAAAGSDGTGAATSGQKSHVFTSSHVGRSTAAAASVSSRRSSGSKSHRRSARRSSSLVDSSEASPVPHGQGLFDKLPTTSKEEILSQKLADYQRTLEAGAGLGIVADPNQEGPPNRPNSPVEKERRRSSRDRPEETKEERRARRALRRRQKMQLEHDRLMRETPWEQTGNPFEAAAARALGIATPGATVEGGGRDDVTSPHTVNVPAAVPEEPEKLSDD